VLLVLAAHLGAGEIPLHRGLWTGWANQGGGFVGVQLFFVLSGYLITGILVRERDRRGGASLVDFYKRRARRLVPALVLVCVGYAALQLIIDPGSWAAARGAIARAATYTTNIPSAWRHAPDSGALAHTWSLAVEEQFYLVWGAMVAFLPRRSIPWAAAAAIVGTIVVRHLLAPHDYTMYAFWRWDALGVGCLLACRRVRLPRFAGWVAAAVIAAYAIHLPDPIRPVDYTLTAAAAGVALVAALNTRWLKNGLLIWFGTISYGLYLWHSVLLCYDIPAVVASAGAIAVAAASWYLLERPIVRGRSARDDHPPPVALPSHDAALSTTSRVAELSSA
jgi:peptidoglycan/LPS O-acetylase OafA/YrhL